MSGRLSYFQWGVSGRWSELHRGHFNGKCQVVGRNTVLECQVGGGNLNGECQVGGGIFNGKCQVV